MIPLRPASLFRSRRAALLYAGGVLWFALDIAGTGRHAPPKAATPSAPDARNVAADDADIVALERQVDRLAGHDNGQRP